MRYACAAYVRTRAVARLADGVASDADAGGSDTGVAAAVCAEFALLSVLWTRRVVVVDGDEPLWCVLVCVIVRLAIRVVCDYDCRLGNGFATHNAHGLYMDDSMCITLSVVRHAAWPPPRALCWQSSTGTSELESRVAAGGLLHGGLVNPTASTLSVRAIAVG